MKLLLSVLGIAVVSLGIWWLVYWRTGDYNAAYSLITAVALAVAALTLLLQYGETRRTRREVEETARLQRRLARIARAQTDSNLELSRGIAALLEHVGSPRGARGLPLDSTVATGKQIRDRLAQIESDLGSDASPDLPA